MTKCQAYNINFFDDKCDEEAIEGMRACEKHKCLVPDCPNPFTTGFVVKGRLYCQELHGELQRAQEAGLVPR